MKTERSHEDEDVNHFYLLLVRTMGIVEKFENDGVSVRLNLKDIYMYIPVKEKKDDGGNYVERVTGSGKKYIDKVIKGIEGEFVKIELYKYHSDELNQELEGFKILLKDGDEKIVLSTGWTSIAQSIINSLAGTPNLGRLAISIYPKTGEDGKTWPRVSIKNNGQYTNWKYSPEEQKGFMKYMDFKGKKHRDDTAYVAQLKEDIEDINNPLDPNEEKLPF